MGDEAFYQLFLFIQIGNYLCNLVFHLGGPDGWRGILPIVPFVFRQGTTVLVEPGVPSGQPKWGTTHSTTCSFLFRWGATCRIESSDFDIFEKFNMLHVFLVWPWNPKTSYKKAFFEILNGFYLIWPLSSEKSSAAPYKSWKNLWELLDARVLHIFENRRKIPLLLKPFRPSLKKFCLKL